MPASNPGPAAEFSPVGRSFSFACHPGVGCFTECCRKLNLLLTPYDILRLKKALGLASGEFLEKHSVPSPDASARWPMLKLGMDPDTGLCPFLSPQGCRVYSDRPSACRIYPLARATSPGYAKGEVREEFFLVKEAHCLGFAEPRTWTIQEWLVDQGLFDYLRFNDRFMEIVTHPAGPGSGSKGEKNLGMFQLAAYNLDRFREFVFSTKFLSLFELEPRRVEAVRADDAELLRLALDWLKFALLGQKTLRVKKAG